MVTMNVGDRDYSCAEKQFRYGFLGLKVIIKLPIGTLGYIHKDSSILVEDVNCASSSMLRWFHR